jgi:hypothetical protein
MKFLTTVTFLSALRKDKNPLSYLRQFSDYTIGWTTEESGIDSGLCLRFRSSVQRLWGLHTLLFNVYVTLCPMVRRQMREADTSAVAKNAWSYASTPPCVFIKWCLMKHSGNFAFITS